MFKKDIIVSLMPIEPTMSVMQPQMPIRLIAVRDLWRIISRKFHLVPKESLWKSDVFSISSGLTFLGV